MLHELIKTFSVMSSRIKFATFNQKTPKKIFTLLISA